MITFRNVLKSKAVGSNNGYTVINSESLIHLIKVNNINLNGFWFYRGINSYEKFMKYNSVGVNRHAVDADNFNNLLFSGILPSWKHIPHRNKSLIGSTSYDDARSYARVKENVYMVFPYNIKKGVAVLPTDDIYNLKYYKITDSMFRLMCYILDIDRDDVNTISDMVNLINKGDDNKNEIFNYVTKKAGENIDDITWESPFFYFKLWKDSNQKLIDFIDSLYINASNSIEIIKNMNADVLDEYMYEVWTEDDCLLINVTMFNKIYNYMKKRD